MLRGAVLWVMFLLLYLLFAASLSTAELIAGAGCASAVAGYAMLCRRASETRFDLRAPWMRVAAGSLLSVPPDILRVGRVLMRSLWTPKSARQGAGEGVLARQAFVQGQNSPADATRRGVVVLAASLAPNGYVIMMPDDSEMMVLHRMAPAPPQRDWAWPV